MVCWGKASGWRRWAELGLGWAGDRGMFPSTPSGQDPSARSITPMEPEVGRGRAGSTAGPGGRRRFLDESKEDKDENETAIVDSEMIQAAPVTKFVSVSTHKILVIGRRMSRSDEPPTTPPLPSPPAPTTRATAAPAADMVSSGSVGILIRHGSSLGNWATTVNDLAEPAADSVGRQDHPKVRRLAGRRHALPFIASSTINVNCG